MDLIFRDGILGKKWILKEIDFLLKFKWFLRIIFFISLEIRRKLILFICMIINSNLESLFKDLFD